MHCFVSPGRELKGDFKKQLLNCVGEREYEHGPVLKGLGRVERKGKAEQTVRERPDVCLV